MNGSVSVTPYADDSPALVTGARVYAGDATCTISAVKRAGSGLALTFLEIRSPDEAEALRGVDLEVLEADLPASPAGVYYHYQIIGAQVVTLEGKTLGRVWEILETPAHDVYVVRPESGGADVLLPAVEGVVREIDPVARVIKVDPPEGPERQGRPVADQ